MQPSRSRKGLVTTLALGLAIFLLGGAAGWTGSTTVRAGAVPPPTPTLVPTPVPTLVPANALQLAQQWCDANNAHDPDRLVALYTEDGVLEDVVFPAVFSGRAALRIHASDDFRNIANFQLNCFSPQLLNGQATMRFYLSGTDVGIRRTNRSFSLVQGAVVIVPRGDKISLAVLYYDSTNLHAQLTRTP